MGRWQIGALGFSVWALLLSHAFGCNSAGKVSLDAGLPDAAPRDAGDAGSDAGPASPIHGTSVVHHVTEKGELTAPVDLTGHTITAWLPDGAGGFTKLPAAGSADGTFSVRAEVPEGPYSLAVQPPSGAVSLTVTPSHAPALDAYRLGRPDAIEAKRGTTLVFDVTGLKPWQPDDDLVLFSPSAGVIVFSPHLKATTGAPAPGATVLSAMSVDYVATYTGGAAPSHHLIEGIKGDIAHLDQLVHGTMPGAAYSVLGAYCAAAPFTQGDGQIASLGCTLTDVPRSQTFAMKMKRASFEGQIGLVHPTALFNETEIVLRVMPAANAHGLYSGSPELVIYEPEPGPGDIDAALAYGNPFPAGWDLYATYLSAFDIPVLAPGASTPKKLHLRVRNDVPFSTVGNDPMRPLVTPPKALRINGKDGFQEQGGVTTTPTLSWQPSDVGPPDQYEVIVHRVDNQSGTTVESIVARLRTKETAATFPPGVLSPGQPYVIEVLASKGQGLPFGSASTITSLITP